MKKIFLLIILLFTAYASFSQEQKKEQISSHQDNGKLYWNKKEPVYITLSSNSLNTDPISLKKPFYLDTEGVNFLRTKWEYDSTGKYVYPLKEQTWEIYADSQPPNTKYRFISDYSYEYKGKKYYSDDLHVELFAEDELSGINKIYYSINGNDFNIYEKFIKFEVGNDVELKFYSVDNVGNIEPISEIEYEYDNNILNFTIDNTPPKTIIQTKDSILSPNDYIILSSDDSLGVGVNSTYYSINDQDYKIYDTPISLKDFDDGELNIKYFSVDWINNKENINTIKLYLDAIAPEINIQESIQKKEITNLRYIELDAIDNLSGVKHIYIKTNKIFVEYIEPFYIDITHDKLTIKVIDNVGNQSIRIVKYNEIR